MVIEIRNGEWKTEIGMRKMLVRILNFISKREVTYISPYEPHNRKTGKIQGIAFDESLETLIFYLDDFNDYMHHFIDENGNSIELRMIS